MIDLTISLIFIIFVFSLIILLKSFSKIKVCAMCAAVSLTWITLLILFYLDYKINPTLIALLLGGTVVGLTNELKSKISEKYIVFKLPFYLLLLFIAYTLVLQTFIQNAFLIVVLVWIFALIIYVFKNSKKLGSTFEKLINCCKNW